MFEKEAEEYAKQNNPAENGVRATHFTVLYSFKDGAEFGYNKAKEDADKMKNQFLELCNLKDMRIEELEKAKEWHYVKDGDLPKGLPKPVLVAFHNKFSDNIVIDIARYSFELNKWWFIHDLKVLEEDVIAWKEIVLPELKESE